jgi:rhomboid protease GluP
MSDPATSLDENIQFLSSSKSQAAKTRVWLFPAILIGTVVGGVQSGFSKATLIGSGIVFVLMFVMDWFILRPAAKVGQRVAELSLTDIQSTRFNTKQKKYVWADIVEATVEVIQGVTVLQLRLKSFGGRPDKRSFITGINLARPYLPLAALTPLDQERLLDAIHLRLRANRLAFGWVAPESAKANALTEERVFQEKLIALAPRTWVAYGLVTLNIAVWFAMLAFGAGLMYGAPAQLLDWGGNSAYEVQRGEWWRLVSATFLHSGMLHLLMNMIGLWVMGVKVERIFGHKLFLLIYLGSGLLGSAFSLHFSAQKVVSVGASGAIFGVAGALLVAVWQHKNDLPKLFGKQTISGMGMFILYSLTQGLNARGIDNAAHLGGLFAGIALAFILPKRFNLTDFNRRVKVQTATALAFLAISVTAVAARAPVGAVDLRALAQSGAAFERGFKAFDQEVKALNQDALDVKSGKLSLLASDERSRAVFAPKFRDVLKDLNAARFPVDDSRAPLVAEYKRLVELLVESLQMESNIVDGKPVPVDQARSDAIAVELLKIQTRIPKLVEQLKAAQRR